MGLLPKMQSQEACDRTGMFSVHVSAVQESSVHELLRIPSASKVQLFSLQLSRIERPSRHV